MKSKFDGIPEPLYLYVDHGVEFSSQSVDQWCGTTQFSEKEDHFYVDPATGKWDEKQLGVSGNAWTFLEKMADHYREHFTPDKQKVLADRFGLPVDAVLVDDVGYDPNTNAYTFASRNEKGTVLDIRRRKLNGKPMSTKGCKVRLWGLDSLSRAKPGSRVYIVEGESDRLAMRWLLKKVGRLKDVVVSCPGAGVFKDDWARAFVGMDVATLFDKDDAGQSGTRQVHAKLRAAGVTAKAWCHDDEWDDGIDIRDFVTHARKSKEITLTECHNDGIIKRLHPLELDDDERPTRPRLVFLTADQVMNTEPPGFIVEGVMPPGVIVLVAPPANAKSFLALDLAIAVASDTPWHGREVEGGYVMLVNAEGFGTFGQRIDAAISALPPEKQRLALSRLLITGDAPAIHRQDDPSLIIERARELDEPPKLVVLDTLARCMPGGDENAAQDMGSFIAGVDRIRDALGCAVLILHHTIKDGTTERGSSALRGACDVMLFCKLRDNALTVTFDKCRDFAPPDPMHFALQPHKESVRLVAVDPAAAIAAGADKLKSGMVLRALEKDGDWMSLGEIKAAANVKDRTARRALGEFVDAGVAERRQDGRDVQWRISSDESSRPTPANAAKGVDRDKSGSRPTRPNRLGRSQPTKLPSNKADSSSRPTRSIRGQPARPLRGQPPGPP
ncbi:MAG: AAA family ATPase [Phycisphaerales bacterium]|nr:AAA family ATPase [Phycisphaerales bacterium]